MQKDCLSADDISAIVTAAGGTPYCGLGTQDCKACMAYMDKLDMDVWPCREDVCQNPKFFASKYPASDPTNTFNCADCVAANDPKVCQLCVSMVPSASSALNKTTTDVLAARAWCVKAATYKIAPNTAGVVGDADGTAPPFGDANANAPTFTAAVTVFVEISLRGSTRV
ncbi:hypothetical protein FOA52_012969 [Chlamydomonas sp. UWO 241]|nr:hypothetical protein FOA52_012969 [Chlamydomonas sp. UWO 241]